MSLLDEVDKINEKLISVRRKLHENPELGFLEFETAKLIKNRLDELGIPYNSEIAKTGIVATIVGKSAGKRLMIRADMDALPLQEDSDVPYKSKNDNVMHACGHDCHVSCLLGAAEILIQKKNEFEGTILLIFQPAEETSPLGYYDVPGGAGPMVLEGAIGDPNNPEIDAAIALHVNAQHPTGTISIRGGPSMGSADEIQIIVKGKGGHGSAPHMAIDPIYISSQIYIGIQGFLSRRIAPIEPRVFTIGKIESGSRHNIISDRAVMEGTFRTLNQEVRDIIIEEVPNLIKSIAETYGGEAEVKIQGGYPVGVNDEGLAKLIQETTIELFGEEKLIIPPAILGAEDFYEFGMGGKIPVAMFWLGGQNEEKGFMAPNHSNYFDFDEDALKIGTTMLVGVALNYLKT